LAPDIRRSIIDVDTSGGDGGEEASEKSAYDD